MREKLINYSYFVVKIPDKARRGRVSRHKGENEFFLSHQQKIRTFSAFECGIISSNNPILDKRGKRSLVFVTMVRSWHVRPST